MWHAPAVKRYAVDLIFVDHFAQALGDELIRNGRAGRDLEPTLIGPKVIRDPIAPRSLAEALLGEPKNWNDAPGPLDGIVADQDQTRQISRRAQIEPAEHHATMKITRLSA